MPANEVEILIKANDLATKQLTGVNKSVGLLRVVAVKAFLDIGKEALKAGKAVLDFALKGTELADRLGDMSAKLGVSTETLSTLGFAAEQTGSSLESMETGVRTLSRQVVMAAQGSKRYADIFADLGVTVTDTNGQIRPTMDLLKGIADGMENVTSATEKAGVMQMLFGSSGTDLIPIMEGGSAAMAKFEERARQLGIVVETEAAAKADKFQDSLAQVKSATTGLSLAFGTTLLPALTPVITMFANLVGEFSRIITGSEKTEEAGRSLADMFAGLVRAMVPSYELLAKSTVILWTFGKAMVTGKNAGVTLVAEFGNMKEAFADIDEQVVRLTNSLKTQEEGVRGQADAARETTDTIIAEMERQSEAHWARTFEAQTIREATAEDEARLGEERRARVAKINQDVAGIVVTSAEVATDALRQAAEVQGGLEQSAGEQRIAIAKAAGKAIMRAVIDQALKELLARKIKAVGIAIMEAPATLGASLLALAPVAAAYAAAHGAISAMKLQRGGLVTGGVRGRDSVPALLEPGELVLPRRVTDFMRKSFEEGPREGGGFQDGGLVGAGAGVTIEAVYVDSLSDYQYIDRFVERINEAVTLRGVRLVATEVRGET